MFIALFEVSRVAIRWSAEQPKIRILTYFYLSVSIQRVQEGCVWLLGGFGSFGFDLPWLEIEFWQFTDFRLNGGLCKKVNLCSSTHFLSRINHSDATINFLHEYLSNLVSFRIGRILFLTFHAIKSSFCWFWQPYLSKNSFSLTCTSLFLSKIRRQAVFDCWMDEVVFDFLFL